MRDLLLRLLLPFNARQIREILIPKFPSIIYKYVDNNDYHYRIVLYFLLLSLQLPGRRILDNLFGDIDYSRSTISRNWTAMLLNGLRRKSRVSLGNYASALLTRGWDNDATIFIVRKNCFLEESSYANCELSARLSPPRLPFIVKSLDLSALSGSRIINHAFYDACNVS